MKFQADDSLWELRDHLKLWPQNHRVSWQVDTCLLPETREIFQQNIICKSLYNALLEGGTSWLNISQKSWQKVGLFWKLKYLCVQILVSGSSGRSSRSSSIDSCCWINHTSYETQQCWSSKIFYPGKNVWRLWAWLTMCYKTDNICLWCSSSYSWVLTSVIFLDLLRLMMISEFSSSYDV